MVRANDSRPRPAQEEQTVRTTSPASGRMGGETVTFPIDLTKYKPLALDPARETLTDTLRTLGAEGTQESFIYAFGLHINPSIPARDADTLRRFLQASPRASLPAELRTHPAAQTKPGGPTDRHGRAVRGVE